MKNYVSLRRELPIDVSRFDGVGILKGEHSGMEGFVTSNEELTKTKKYIKVICHKFYPKPVWYRTNDASTGFVNQLKGFTEFDEPNRHFGLRGIRRLLINQDEFMVEIDMINKVREEYSNLNIFFPMVNDVEQYKQGRDLARSFGYTGRIGIMAETPSAVLTLDEFIKEGVDYVVIGLNDLTDCMDGSSRKNTNTNHLIYRDPELKAVKKLFSQMRRAYTQNNGNIEFVLSGDFKPEVITLLKDYKFDAIAIPYSLCKNNKEYEMIAELLTNKTDCNICKVPIKDCER